MGRADQKIIADRYRAFPRTLCFITHGDDVLLLRGAADKKIWPSRYNGVGGHVKPNEDVETAALREIREETGLAVEDLRLRGVINIPTNEPNTGILVFVFTARAAERGIRGSAEGQPQWIRRDRILELDLVEDLPVMLPIVLSMGEDDEPFFALYTYDENDRLQIALSPGASAPRIPTP